MISTRIYLNHRDLDIYNWNQAQVKQFNAGSFTTIWMIVVVKNHDVLTNMICMINIKEILWLYDVVSAYIINANKYTSLMPVRKVGNYANLLQIWYQIKPLMHVPEHNL